MFGLAMSWLKSVLSFPCSLCTLLVIGGRGGFGGSLGPGAVVFASACVSVLLLFFFLCVVNACEARSSRFAGLLCWGARLFFLFRPCLCAFSSRISCWGSSMFCIVCVSCLLSVLKTDVRVVFCGTIVHFGTWSIVSSLLVLQIMQTVSCSSLAYVQQGHSQSVVLGGSSLGVRQMMQSGCLSLFGRVQVL